ncbi:HNH endonuclease signature motif containing protein [Aquibacillus rhizosphaerae]|uniref:HNH endonuclease n=1 Tax=Aquibacillus rhizosphaerae TaxID=3051431 RepID=A0ABT7LAC2_9BACI|nr:hypothetical protein [Aquibacillus sp. LR5S19]MDL4842135.1 hypothetical protein [Aquibacillus sp. LR5S19]
MLRKISILLIVVVLVTTPYSFNGSYFTKNLVPNRVDANASGDIEILDIEPAVNEFYEYIPEEVQILESIEEQIVNIEENLDTLQEQEIDHELENAVEELKAIDMEQVVANEIQKQSNELTLDNTEEVIEVLEDENLTISEVTESILNDEETTLEEAPEEEINGEIIEDPIANEIESTDIDELNPENALLDTEVTVNIVKTKGDESIVIELGEFVEEVKEQSEPESYSLFQKSTVSASNSGWGYFLAVKNTAVADMNTKSAKFVNMGTFTKAGGVLKPKSYTMKLQNKRKTTSSGSYSTSSTKNVSSAKLGKTYYLESSISKTYFWKAYASFTGTFKDGSKDVDNTASDRFLLNKKGVPYPTYKDKKSKKTMSEPSSTTWTKKYYPESWTTSKRNKYLNWYEGEYGKINRSEYEIHHIRPRVYYGSNSNSNLIPLKKSFHKKVSTWWKNY